MLGRACATCAQAGACAASQRAARARGRTQTHGKVVWFSRDVGGGARAKRRGAHQSGTSLRACTAAVKGARGPHSTLPHSWLVARARSAGAHGRTATGARGGMHASRHYVGMHASQLRQFIRLAERPLEYHQDVAHAALDVIGDERVLHGRPRLAIRDEEAAARRGRRVE